MAKEVISCLSCFAPNWRGHWLLYCVNCQNPGGTEAYGRKPRLHLRSERARAQCSSSEFTVFSLPLRLLGPCVNDCLRFVVLVFQEFPTSALTGSSVTGHLSWKYCLNPVPSLKKLSFSLSFCGRISLILYLLLILMFNSDISLCQNGHCFNLSNFFINWKRTLSMYLWVLTLGIWQYARVLISLPSVARTGWLYGSKSEKHSWKRLWVDFKVWATVSAIPLGYRS